MSIRIRGARTVVIASLVAGGLTAGTQPAHATYHFMMIREVFAGSAAHPNAKFVELQMYASGQNFVAGKQIKIFDTAGNQIGQPFTFSSSVPNGASQATILAGTTDVQAAFNLTPDLTMPPVIAAAGGKACFFDPGDPYDPGFPPRDIDCVAWGSYSGPNTGTGTPTTAIPSGMSIERRITGGNPAALDFPGDDTDNSAADFQSAAPSPQKNVTTAPGADTAAPKTDIGKPVKGKTYNDSTFRRFRGTATDSGSGLALVEIALRQTLDNGCRWWNGKRFKNGACNKKRFKPAAGLGAWRYLLSRKLKPSNEGNIRFYTLFARATDMAGNVESQFQKGRNANRFEIA